MKSRCLALPPPCPVQSSGAYEVVDVEMDRKPSQKAGQKGSPQKGAKRSAKKDGRTLGACVGRQCGKTVMGGRSVHSRLTWSL